MRTIPVDLILHTLAEHLAEHPADETPGCYADPIARCIDHRRLAEEWTCGAGREQHARWFVRRLSGEDMGLSSDHPMVAGDTRAIEVAVARRLADHAFAMTIEQDKDLTVIARTLLRAACAVVGLADDHTALVDALAQARADFATIRDVARTFQDERDAARVERDKAWAEVTAMGRDLRRIRQALSTMAAEVEKMETT